MTNSLSSVATKTPVKKGATSLYIVIFIAILMGVITFSFIRLIISDTTQTTNTDLSQSAYDAALAGIEDGKVALLKYHDCIDRGITTSVSESQATSAGAGSCEWVVYQMHKGINAQSCDTVQSALDRSQSSDSSVIVQEVQDSSTDNGNAALLYQAYTCVTVSEELPDYRSFLNATNRVRIIPLRVNNFASLQSLRLHWFSDQNNRTNESLTKFTNTDGIFQPLNASQPPIPPAITATVIQTDNNFSLSELSISNNSHNGTDTSTLVFYPQASGGDNTIETNTFIDANDKTPNSLNNVNCSTSGDFLCNVAIDLPPTFQNGTRKEGTAFLLLTLPYGDPSTDFSIEACSNAASDATCNVLSFQGVQSKIDSTGRANDHYRRIETRLEVVDTYFPYPEFAIQLKDGLEKTFYVNRNCWMADNGQIQSKDNKGTESACVDSRVLRGLSDPGSKSLVP